MTASHTLLNLVRDNLKRAKFGPIIARPLSRGSLFQSPDIIGMCNRLDDSEHTIAGLVAIEGLRCEVKAIVFVIQRTKYTSSDMASFSKTEMNGYSKGRLLGGNSLSIILLVT